MSTNRVLMELTEELLQYNRISVCLYRSCFCYWSYKMLMILRCCTPVFTDCFLSSQIPVTCRLFFSRCTTAVCSQASSKGLRPRHLTSTWTRSYPGTCSTEHMKPHVEARASQWQDMMGLLLHYTLKTSPHDVYIHFKTCS